MAHLDTPFADHMEPLTVTKFKFWIAYIYCETKKAKHSLIAPFIQVLLGVPTWKGDCLEIANMLQIIYTFSNFITQRELRDPP